MLTQVNSLVLSQLKVNTQIGLLCAYYWLVDLMQIIFRGRYEINL